MILRDRVAVVTRTQSGTDPYGDPTYSDSEMQSPAEVRPLDSAEYTGGRQTTVTRWRVFLPAGVAATATSAIVWRGVTHEIEGEPEDHGRGPNVHHRELVMRRVAG